MSELLKYIDPELDQLANTRGYSFGWKRGHGAWLYWSEKCERVGQYPWDAIFKPFQLFIERPGHSSSPSLYTTHGLGERLSLGEKAYYETVQALEKLGDTPQLHNIPQLSVTRDALEKYMYQLARQLESLLPSVERVMQVWVAETERVLLEEGRASAVIKRVKAKADRRYHHNRKALQQWVEEDQAHSAADAQRQGIIEEAMGWDGAANFYRDASFLWGYMTRGIEREGLERLLGRYDEEYFTHPLVARSTRSGLLHFHEHIAPIHDKLFRLDVKRSVGEELLSAILLDEDLPAWETVKERLHKTAPVYENEKPIFESKKYRSNAKWYPYGRFIVNRNEKLLAQGVNKTAERARQIGLRLNEHFDIDASGFTSKQLQRVLKAHHERKFNDA